MIGSHQEHGPVVQSRLPNGIHNPSEDMVRKSQIVEIRGASEAQSGEVTRSLIPDGRHVRHGKVNEDKSQSGVGRSANARGCQSADRFDVARAIAEE